MEDFKDLKDLYTEDGEIDVQKLLVLALPDYFKLIKSEEIAKAEMAAYDKEYNDVLEDRKDKYALLLQYVTATGIQVPKEAYNYTVGLSDVLQRLDEQMSFEINDIEERANRFLEADFSEELIDQANEAIFETSELYEKIKNNYIKKNVKTAILRRKHRGNKN